MGPMRTANIRTRALLCAFLVLFSSGMVSAGLLNWRQEDGQSKTSGTPTSSPPDASTSPATTGPSETAATTTGTGTGTGTKTGTGTAAATSETAATAISTSISVSNSTSSVAAAATSDLSSSHSLNNTNDPNKCHKELPEDGGNPFCKPSDGQTILVDKEFEVTWDPTSFAPNSTNTISLLYLQDNGASTDDLSTLQTTSAPNSQGAIFLTLNSSALHNKSSSHTNLTLTLSNPNHSHHLSGPTLTLLSKDNNTSSSPSSSSNKKKLGEEVGIPIGLIFLIAGVGVIALFLYMRKRRIGGSRGGYSSSKSARSQRIAAATAPVTGANRGHHRRDPSFHDEPTRGMELQNRAGAGAAGGAAGGGSGGDNWDWGSPVSSPTNTTITGGRDSNAFRDEIQRQRSGKRG